MDDLNVDIGWGMLISHSIFHANMILPASETSKRIIF